ncbi:MAG: preprotein translocase subunit SecG [Candidatus Gracilibacteria bacterium]|nr:preprotein translocase subunit SecG [Candidatus Gracilibacteria bacterium]
MLEILKISEIIICVLLVLVILIQNKNVSLNLSSMSGGMTPIQKRGAEKVLQNTTIVLGTLFVVNSILLAFVK